MAGERVVPGLGGLISAFWTHHSDGWHTKMDTNLRALASLTQLSVISRVTSVPGSPSDGDIHIVTAGGDATKVAVRDNAAWVYFTPVEGWVAWDRATNEILRFNGSAWVVEVDDGIADAPSDGQEYVRKDAGWTVSTSTGITEAPNDGDAYVRQSEAWETLEDALADLDVVIDAPGDGTPYVRRNNAWEDGADRFLGDAPSDGDEYVRKDGGWVVNSGGSGAVPEAPNDGVQYGRQSLGWTAISHDLTIDAGETASFTLDANHAALIPCSHGSTPIVCTVPPNSSVAFPVGKSFTLLQDNAAAVSFDEGAGVTFKYAADMTPFCRVQNSVITATKTDTNEWSIYGDMLPL